MSTAVIHKLRRAICADPQDDALRISLADAYDDAGENERARLIRLQLERHRLPTWHESVIDLELEERALLEQYEERWLAAESPESIDAEWGPFERGLISSARFPDPGELADAAMEICAAVPLERVFVEWPYRTEPMLPRMPGVHALTMLGTDYEADLERLVASPAFESVRVLTLFDSAVQRLDALAKSNALLGLRVPNHQLGNDGLAPILEMPDSQLKELVLSGASRAEAGSGDDDFEPSFDERGAYALALWPGLSKIEALDVSSNRLGLAGLGVLLASPRTAALRRLTIRKIADEEWDMDNSLSALSLGPAGHLEELDISENDLDEAGAKALADGPALESLKVLKMTSVRSNHIARLSRAQWIHELRILHCDASMLPEMLVKSPESLHTLVVNLPTEAQSFVANMPLLPALRTLIFRGGEVDDEVLRRLGEAASLPELAELRIERHHEITAAGAQAFLGQPLAQRLVSIDLGFPDIARLPRHIRRPVHASDYAELGGVW